MPCCRLSLSWRICSYSIDHFDKEIPSIALQYPSCLPGDLGPPTWHLSSTELCGLQTARKRARLRSLLGEDALLVGILRLLRSVIHDIECCKLWKTHSFKISPKILCNCPSSASFENALVHLVDKHTVHIFAMGAEWRFSRYSSGNVVLFPRNYCYYPNHNPENSNSPPKTN